MRSTLLAALLIAGLPTGCSNPAQSNGPHAILVHGPADSVLKIGSAATFSWECVDCGDVQARTVEAYIVEGGGPLRLFSGPLTGSANWVVGTADDPRSLPGGLMRPGEYVIDFQSGNVALACGQDCPGVEAMSSPSAVRITLVP